jgi:LysR family transcriptional activator of nhaA
MAALNFHHLHYFWAVAHEGHLTRAAEKLHVSQSAVSVQIQKLEKSLGHDLFHRRGRELVLTEAGRIALDHADAIFSLGRELVGTLNEERRELVVLRVGSMATLSRNFQTRFLAPLFGREDVEIVIRSGRFQDLLRALEAHRIDVLLANQVPPRDAATRWVAHAMAEQPLGVIGTPALAADIAETPGAGEDRLRALLTSAPLVLPAAESAMRIGFDALVDRLEIRPRIAAEVDDMAMLRLVAREGVGLAVIPPIVVRDELAGGELVELAELPGLKETFYAITPTRRFPNPLLKGLVREGRVQQEEEA